MSALSPLHGFTPPDSSFFLWFRLYTYALFCESCIFDIDLCNECPDYMATGFMDIWKGNYRGGLVCIKAVRIQDPACMELLEWVCSSFLLSEVYSVNFIPDLPSQNLPPERAPHHQCFGSTASVLHNEPVDARWEHYPVHPGEPECQPVGVGMCPLT